jgi:hypothetical protein
MHPLLYVLSGCITASFKSTMPLSLSKISCRGLAEALEPAIVDKPLESFAPKPCAFALNVLDLLNAGLPRKAGGLVRMERSLAPEQKCILRDTRVTLTIWCLKFEEKDITRLIDTAIESNRNKKFITAKPLQFISIGYRATKI